MMIVYLLKSALCLMVLLLIHRLILQRETMHQFNRFFLLMAVVGSFLIPLITIEVAQEAKLPIENQRQAEFQTSDFSQTYSPNEASEVAAKAVIAEKSFDWKMVFWMVYGSGSMVFLIRFIRNINLLRDKINRNIHLQYKGETLILIEEETLPFSFLSYIFVSKKSFANEKLTDAVFAHEQAHVHGKHSWDILLIEAILVPFWFHPGLYYARQVIKLNHEFIADQAALGATPLENYNSLLLSMILPDQKFGLASRLNFSLTKKRFEMLKRRTANSTKWIKIMSVIPVLAVLIYIFSEKVTAQAEEEKKPGEIAINNDSASQEKKEINILLRADGKIEVDGQIIEVSDLAEWIDSKFNRNTLVRFSADPEVEMGFVSDVHEIFRENDIRRMIYEEQTKQKQEVSWQEEHEAHFRDAYILVEDDNMEYTHKTYYQLTEKEKKGLFGPMKPSPKSHPDPTLFESWKDKTTHALWIDGVVSSNEKLEDFESSDFVFFFQSSVKLNARSERFPQPYQVHLYSDAYYDLVFGPDSEGRRPRTNRDTITLTQRMVTWNHDISRNPDSNTAFLQKNAQYEKLRKSGKTFNQNELEELNQLYRELNEEYTKSSDKRKKSLKQPIPPQTQPENKKPVSTSNENNQISLAAFGELNGAYQVKLNQKGLFVTKTEIEIEDLFELYSSLQEKYTDLSYEDKRVIRRPIFPFARLEKDGKVIFKRFEDLTEEERKGQNC